MKVNNQIQLCCSGKKKFTDLSRHEYFVIHRITRANDIPNKYFKDIHPIQDENLTGELIAKWFADTRRVFSDKYHWADRPGVYSRGRMPYHFIVRTDGTVDQCKSIEEMGYHSIGYNGISLGCAFVGDFRENKPTKKQIESFIEIIPLFISLGYKIIGHDGLKGGSIDQNKRCPGTMFPLKRLIKQSENISSNEALSIEDSKDILRKKGFII